MLGGWLVLFLFNEFDISSANFCEEIAGSVWAKFCVSGLDGDEETIVSCAMELLASEEWMVEAWKLNEAEETEQYCEAREQDRKLEHHREKRWNGKYVGRLCLNDCWVDHHLCCVGESKCGDAASDTTKENKPRKNGAF